MIKVHYDDGKISYSVSKNNKSIINQSMLGIEADKFVFERLETGKKAYFKGDDGKFRKVELDSPMRNKDNEKSFKVYRRNKKKDKHNDLPVAKVIYWGMNDPKTGRSSIKNDDPARSKSFFARHNCDSKKDKDTSKNKDM